MSSAIDRSRARKAIYAITALGLICAWYATVDARWQSDASFHTLLETLATCAALAVGTVALLRFYARPQNGILLLGAGFLGTALLDGHHAVVTSQWFAHHWPSPAPQLTAWSWNASRVFLASLLVMSWWAWAREQRLGERGHISDRGVFAIVGLLLLTIFSLFALLPLPPAYYSNLPIPRPEELIAGSLFVLALGAYLSKGDWKRDAFEHAIVLSLVVSAVTQVLFMASSSAPSDAMFDAAHVLKLGSYVCVLAGLLRSTYELFLRVKETNSDLVAMQDQLERHVQQRTVELQRSNAELDSFAYIASHDLRAPLRAIDNLSLWIEEDLKDALEEETRENLKLLRGRVRRLEGLLDDLLVYSRIGRRKHLIETVDTRELVETLVRLLSPPEGFAIELAADLPVLETTRTPLEQVLRSLIDNSIKHAGSNTGRIEICAREEGDCWEFSVVDEGPGIPPELREKAFAMFQTLKSRDKVEGSGIGLAVAKKNVEFLGGRIWAESPGGARGAVLRFLWPKNVPSAVTAPKE